MPGPTQLPAYIQLRYDENGVFNKLQSGVRSATEDAQRQFDRAFGEIDQTVRRALSVQRNQFGSLDLGAKDLREAAAAQQAIATAAEEVARATRAAAEAEGDFSQRARQSVASAEALAREKREAAAAAISHAEAVEQVQRQLDRNRSATGAVIGANTRLTASSRQVSQATAMAGQQFADISVQLVSGQRASMAFAQQIPQLGWALSGLASSSNATTARIGTLATMLSGTLGVALGFAAGALVDLALGMNDAEDAANGTTGALDAQIGSVEDLRQAIRTLRAEQEESLQTERERQVAALATANSLRQQAAAALEAALAEQTRRSASPELGQRDSYLLAGREAIEADIARLRETIDEADIVVRQAEIPLARRSAEIATDPVKAINSRYNRRARELEDDYAAGSGELRSGVELTRALARLNVERQREIDLAKEAEKQDKDSGRSRTAAANRAAREAERLANFGERAAETIARTNERFDEQPRLIDQAAQSMRELDRIIAELGKRRPAGFEDLIEQAQDAKDTIEDALDRPFRDLEAASRDRLAIEELIAAGRDDEARALQEVLRLEEQIGTVSDDRRAQILEMVRFEEQRTAELRRQRELFDAQLAVISTAKDGLRDLLSGRSVDFFGDIKQALADLQGARLFDRLFGDAFQAIEDEMRDRSPLGRATKRLVEGVDGAKTQTDNLATAAEIAAGRILSATNPLAAVNDNPMPGGAGVGPDGEIVVIGERGDKVEIEQFSVNQIADKMADAIVSPLLEGMDDIFGTAFTQQMAGVLKGALSGYIQAGTVGGVIGGLKGLSDEVFGAGSGVSGALGDALGGAQFGTQMAGLADMFGIGMSNDGAAIGGAIGAALPIPGGQIIGSIAGGLLGGLFKSNKTARALLTGGDDMDVAGAWTSKYGIAEGLGGTVLDALNRIADELGGDVGSFYTSIGVRGGDYRVNTDSSSLKIKNGAVNFGDDQEAATRFAILDAITDGAIKGISDAEQRLLREGKDLDSALQDVFDFRSVFDRLKQYKDPVGYALDQVDKEFEDLIDLFERAGASAEEFAQLEELYGIERAKAIEEASERINASLKSLLDELTIGDSGLSLRSRQQNALAEYQPLAERVAAGDTTAYDDYADAARSLLDIERQMFGSTQAYFDRFEEITNLTRERIDGDANVASIASNRDSPFDSAGRVKDAVETQTEALSNWLSAVNDNIIGLRRDIAANAWTARDGTFDYRDFQYSF